jgi:hypothetical protein
VFFAQLFALSSCSASTKDSVQPGTGAVATTIPSRRCLAADLSGHGGRQGDKGGAVGDIVLVNNGSAACSLTALPAVVLTAAGAKLAIQQRPVTDSTQTSAVLAAGDSTGVTLLVYWANWCKPNPGPLRAVISLPGNGGDLDVPLIGPPAYDYVPRCDLPDEPSTIQATSYVVQP